MSLINYSKRCHNRTFLESIYIQEWKYKIKYLIEIVKENEFRIKKKNAFSLKARRFFLLEINFTRLKLLLKHKKKKRAKAIHYHTRFLSRRGDFWVKIKLEVALKEHYMMATCIRKKNIYTKRTKTKRWFGFLVSQLSNWDVLRPYPSVTFSSPYY